MPRQSVLGKNINKFDHPAFKMLQRGSTGDTIRHEIQLGEQDDLHWYDTRISAIFTKYGFVAGRMIIWHEITDRKQIEDRLRHASTHDQLTGLYNRMYFDEAFDRITHTGPWPVAILMLDLDNLKETNDSYGHEAGDKLLRHAAQVLSATFRQDDVVARIGGDEFAIIVPRCNKNNVEKLVERLREAITQPFELLPATKLEFSVGYAIANNVEELQSAKNLADQRMYADKSRRKLS
jgi:diguanylate cyclase (GGDEF)-like protein